jgi:hypothetical protein
MQIPGQNGFPKGLVSNNYDSIQPRVGFSYDLTGDGKTVLRGGFGTFFERLQGNDIYGTANNSPYQSIPGLSDNYFANPHCSWNSQTATNFNTTPSSACLSATTLPILATGVTSLSLSYPPPAVAQYSLGIQRELRPSLIWVIQYVGNNAWHQSIDRQIDNFPLSTSNLLRAQSAGHGGAITGNDADNNLTINGNGNALRTYAGYSGVDQEENTTNGTYNGFETSVRVQNRWGLSGELDYTWSHVIDIQDTDITNVSNPYYFKYDKGSGGYDRRNILQGNYIYKLPIFNKSTGVLHSVLGGWELAGTFVAENGTPTSAGVSDPIDPIALGGGYSNRAQIVGPIHYHHKVADWFDTTTTNNCPAVIGADGNQLTAAVSGPLCYPTPGWLGGPNLGFGNGKRDSLVEPNRVNFTTSLYKSFAVTERAHFEFRAETFNTFNHTEFSGIGNSLGGGQYGQANATWDPRVMELGAKFVF